MTTNVHAMSPSTAAYPADTPGERLARGGGWWTFILALVMLLAMTEALNTAAWSEGLDVVRLAVFGGALLGFLLSLTRWEGVFPACYGCLASLFWIATQFNTFIFKGLTAQEGVQELLRRNGEWLFALFGGKASADNLIFVTQLAFLGWWIGYLALWSLMRHQRVMHAIIPAGVALLVNAYFAPASLTGYIILFLATVLLLAIRVELARNEARWQIARVRYAPDIALDFLKAGVMFSVVVITLAWALPNVANTVTVERLLRPFDEPWHTVQDTWRRMYRSLNYGQATTRVSAFGKTTALGGPVSLTDRPIFEADTPESVYWRAAVYDTYTGQGWLNTDPETVVIERGQPLGEPQFTATREITTTIRPLENGQEIVFGPPSPTRLSVPVSAEAILIPGGAQRSVSLLRSRVNLNRAGSYQIVSAVSDAAPDRLRADNTDYPSWVRGRYLQLPETLPARIQDLAAKITMAYTNPYDKAEALEAVLRTYTYNQGIAAPPAGADGVDYFLFDIREGYCDYYASALVVMLRAVGIPARFAQGYTPGQVVPLNARDDSGLTKYRVLERNAHAWPEVYFPSYGWIQFEPTASEPMLVRPAPEQQEALSPGLNPATPPNAGNTDDLLPDRGRSNKLAAQPSAGDFRAWLARAWGWLALAFGILGAAGGGWALARRRQAALFHDAESLGRLFELLGVWAARLRVFWPDSHTPLEHAAEFNRMLPEAAPAVDRIAALFMAQQYGRQQPAPGALAGLAGDWQALQPRLWRRWLDELVGKPEGKGLVKK